MAGRIEGKVTLITGAASGIGRATALLFADEGARLMLSDRDVHGGQSTAEAIRSKGGKAAFFAADLANPDEVGPLIKKTVETYGRLDCAFNNAGILGEHAATAECSMENWNRVIALNLTAVFACMQHEIRQMLPQDYGAIVNISSVAGLVGLQRIPAYVASKFGVAGLTKAAAIEYARSGIRVNAVCPGFINTPMVQRNLASGNTTEAEIFATHPMGRMGTAEEIAKAVLWLASDDSAFVTGALLSADGGYVAQ